ncbi:hypothetical protein Q5P01_007643 [Channa striata]|uniref:Uncharacterized protein n=1 Tax=Channa striata TaxID=64152 RepID=A0AA88SYU1_CHASR|nr:hypothetical protein Q5P01_007643 [Channa striata]
MRVREAERERTAEGGCAFLSLQHQQRGEGTINFTEEEKAQVDKEASVEKHAKSCQKERSVAVERGDQQEGVDLT